MSRQFRVLCSLALLGAALVTMAPLSAQQPAAQASTPTQAGTPSEEPTKKNPLRFSAFNVSMPTGMSGVTEIVIERWTTTAERTKLLGLVETAKYGEGGQRKLLDALQKVKPRVGFIRTPNSIGWDLGTPSRARCPTALASSSLPPTSRSASPLRRATGGRWTIRLRSSRCG